jgi:hypothetical protein
MDECSPECGVVAREVVDAAFIVNSRPALDRIFLQRRNGLNPIGHLFLLRD